MKWIVQLLLVISPMVLFILYNEILLVDSIWGWCMKDPIDRLSVFRALFHAVSRTNVWYSKLAGFLLFLLQLPACACFVIFVIIARTIQCLIKLTKNNVGGNQK